MCQESSFFLDLIIGSLIYSAANFSKGATMWNRSLWKRSETLLHLHHLSGLFLLSDFHYLWSGILSGHVAAGHSRTSVDQKIMYIICWLLIGRIPRWSAQWPESKFQILAFSPPCLSKNLMGYCRHQEKYQDRLCYATTTSFHIFQTHYSIIILIDNAESVHLKIKYEGGPKNNRNRPVAHACFLVTSCAAR
jgi:hypothetical protein